MNNKNAHTHGAVSWTDLHTTDPDAAQRFYNSLFGWNLTDAGATSRHPYAVAKLQGQSVAGITQLDRDLQTQGAGPHWAVYISVDDVAKRAQLVAKAGGKVLVAPFDVPDVGTMAVVQDPTGATLCLSHFTGQGSRGAEVKNRPSAISWAELTTTDGEKAGNFYSQVLGGGRTEYQPRGGRRYSVLETNAVDGMGIVEADPAAKNAPRKSQWTPYFAVNDCDELAAQAIRLGGKVLVAPQDVPGLGRFAFLQDPQGATFGILQTKYTATV